jgi:hypothetical protein
VNFLLLDAVTVCSLALWSLSPHELVTLPVCRSHPSSPTDPNHEHTSDSFQPPLAAAISRNATAHSASNPSAPQHQRRVVQFPISWSSVRQVLASSHVTRCNASVFYVLFSVIRLTYHVMACASAYRTWLLPCEAHCCSRIRVLAGGEKRDVILDLKLSACYGCHVLSSGWFPDVCSLTCRNRASYI